MFRTLGVIFAKETRDLLRDRSALFLLFATPLLMPLLGAVGGVFMIWQMTRQTREGLSIIVVNGEQVPRLVAKLEAKPLLQLMDTSTDWETELQSGKLTAVLEAPPNATERLESEKPITFTLTSGRGGWQSGITSISVQEVLDEYSDELLAERLANRELDQDWVEPIRLEQDVAATTGVAAAPVEATSGASSLLSSIFVVMAIISWLFSGGLTLMAGMTVGEKEHHTMESLLITPASRIGIVLGKIGLSIIVSVITIGLWSLDSLAYLLILSLSPSGSEGLVLSGSTQLENAGLSIVWLMLLMLPLMIMISGLVAAVCTLSKNQRESNLFLGFLQLLIAGLAFLAVFGINANPAMGVYAFPIIGVLVAIRDLFGGGVAPEVVALTWATAATYAVGAVLLAAYVFSRDWALMRGV